MVWTSSSLTPTALTALRNDRSASTGVAFIPGWSKHPNAAQVLFDFMSSEEGQAIINKNSISPLPGIPGLLDSQYVQVGDLSLYTSPGYIDTATKKWQATFHR